MVRSTAVDCRTQVRYPDVEQGKDLTNLLELLHDALAPGNCSAIVYCVKTVRGRVAPPPRALPQASASSWC